MSNPFDFVNSINSGKELDDIEGYVPFIINRQFSYFPDTIFIVNEINRYPHLDNDMQYRFLINTIRPKRRFAKWSKCEHTDDLDAICEYFKCSYERAHEIVDVLTRAQLSEIKEQLEKGGISHGHKKSRGGSA